ncbi:bifunctional nuclease family protein [Sodalinema gerasimenkoae]|uniref:bifunctional nuclease family protein n=1 Tax=Sodalinema gerasimenkoae TaxID=2862348 RepID=UPI00135964D3|nr:bifunctional nuclease family protein [Sodalinema gerasimenkoae]MCC5896341.1 bifunctional nuclease family protein [Phormidium sp. BM_Day4_Bin.17]UCJ11431.1 MAG: bifunctional nuclease family protein [Phormidium sp. PBR-2020]
MIEMKVAGIALDAATRSPIVLLRDASERRALPIYISQDQARSIISAIEQQTPPRPMTHDLMMNILDAWDLTLERVIVHALEDNTFFAVLKMVSPDGKVKHEIDARPSDAIALALRTDASIWVMEEVVADASIPVDRDADEAERQAFREFINNLSPQELIKRAGQEFSDSSDS